MSLKNLLFVFASVILMLSSCNKSTEISNAIPADAKYVLYVDNKSLISKSEYDIFQNQTVQRGINMAKAFIKDQDQIKLIDSFLKDANSLGVNFKNDFYMYTNYNVYGVVLGINNSKKVKEVLIKSSLIKEENLKEEKGIFSTSPQTGTCLTWDDEKITLLVDLSEAKFNNNSEPIDVTALSKELLNQGSDKSINSNKEYQEFWKNRKDISVFYSMDGIDQILAFNKIQELDVDSKKLSKEFEGLSVGAYISFKKGEIQYSNKLLYSTPDTEKKIKDQFAQISGTLKGDHLKYITEEPLFATSVNLKGEGLEKYLKTLGFVDYMNNQLDSIDAVAFNQIIKDVNGDATVAITKIETKAVKSKYSDSDVYKSIPQCLLFIDINDPYYILNLIKEKTKDSPLEITEINPSAFSASVNDVQTYFGVINNTFFVTNIESVYKNLTSSDLKNNYTKLIKDKSAVAFGDVQVLKSLLTQNGKSLYMSNKDLSALLAVTGILAKYQISVSSTNLEAEGKIDFVNKNDNSLKVICKSIDEQINKLVSGFF